MEYRLATVADIPAIEQLQARYHVNTISDEDRPDGFVTTLFTSEQFQSLIEEEQGLSIAVDEGKVVGYAMAASWDYWSAWPLFQHMIGDLPNIQYLGQNLSTTNSYQYGPICIDKAYRGTKVLPNLFEYSRQSMADKYPIMVTFINQINPRSLKAHVDKLKIDIVKPFVFNNNNYYALAYDMRVKTAGSTI